MFQMILMNSGGNRKIRVKQISELKFERLKAVTSKS